MNDNPTILPCELAYIFSYMKVGSVIGWGSAPFDVPSDRTRDEWFEAGRDALLAAGRLVEGNEAGRHRFEDSFRRIAEALADPQVVLMAQRKHEAGVRLMTQHMHGTDVVELIRHTDGSFVATLQSFAAASGAVAAFGGASADAVDKPVRIEANHKLLRKIDALADAGEVDKVLPTFEKLGATPEEAKSALLAFARPQASAVVSLLYCAANAVQDAETYTLLTNAAGHTWILFPPADADGPVVLERSSVGALAARLMVTLSARMLLPQS